MEKAIKQAAQHIFQKVFALFKENKYELFFLIVLALIYVVNINRSFLWQDEAEVGVIARHILHTGLPVAGRDGIIPIANYDGFHTSWPPYIYVWQTWLMFYVGALTMFFGGESVFFLRLPFVVFGLFSLVIFYKLSYLVTHNKNVAKVSFILLSLSTQYIIFSRYARYYTLVFFFSLLAIYAFIRYFIVKERKRNQGYVFVVSMICLFHAHYLSFFGIFFGLILYMLLDNLSFFSTFLKTQKVKSHISQFLKYCTLILLFTIPWLIIFRAKYIFQDIQLFSSSYFSNLLHIPNKINRTVPLLLLVPSFVLTLIRNNHYPKKEMKLAAFLILATFTVVHLATSMDIPPSISAELRYVLGVYPLLYIYLGISIFYLSKISKLVGFLVLTLVLLTNVFSLPYEALIREQYWPMKEKRVSIKSYFGRYMLQELLNGYKGPTGSIISFINDSCYEHGSVFSTGEAISLVFHLPNFRHDNIYSFTKRYNRSISPEDLIQYDLVIFRNSCPISCVFKSQDEALSIIEGNFEKITLPVFDYIVDNREEIPYHFFSKPVFKPFVEIYVKNCQKPAPLK